MNPPTIVVLEGDQTGQELLLDSMRVLDKSVIDLELDFERYDLSLEKRRATNNQVVLDAAEAMRKHKLGLKAATITPEQLLQGGKMAAFEKYNQSRSATQPVSR